MKIGIRTLFAALLLAAAVALPRGLSAQNGAAGPGDHRLIPSVGIPFASGSFFGTVDITGFAARDGRIVADTLLRVGQRTTPARLPVKLVRATCTILELHIGPPPGARLPLLITQHAGNSELRQPQLCAIAHAASLRARVAALNEHERLARAAATAASCPWYWALACSAALGTCGLTCSLGSAACTECLTTIGAGGCIPCFFGG